MFPVDCCVRIGRQQKEIHGDVAVNMAMLNTEELFACIFGKAGMEWN